MTRTYLAELYVLLLRRPSIVERSCVLPLWSLYVIARPSVCLSVCLSVVFNNSCALLRRLKFSAMFLRCLVTVLYMYNIIMTLWYDNVIHAMLDYFVFPPSIGRGEALCSQPVRMVTCVCACTSAFLPRWQRCLSVGMSNAWFVTKRKLCPHSYTIDHLP